MKLIKFLPFLFILGCNPYNKYSSPEVCVPQEWKGEVVEEGAESECQWWVIFGDATLNCLEEQAVESNRELEQAWYAFEEGVARSRVVRAKLFPQIQLNPSYDRLDQSVSFNGLPGAPGSVRLNRKSYTFPFDGQYEVDLWNKIGLETRSRVLSAEALCWALKSLRLAITAQLAENYFAIRTLDSEIDILQRTIASRENQVSITRSRYDAGLVNYTDVSRSETELFNVKADLEDVFRLRSELVNATAVLIGQPASCFELSQDRLQQNLPTIPAQLPSELVSMRPDIRQAETEVAAAHADIGVAWAGFFPSFSISGTVGYSSPFYSDLFTWQTRLWAYAYNISQVIFDGGALYSTYQASKDAYFQRVSAYQQAVLVAFKEVENALANIHFRFKQEQNLIESVRASKDTLDLTNLRYDKGVIDYLDVVDAERTSLTAERSEVRTRGAQFVATVALVKALGGSW